MVLGMKAGLDPTLIHDVLPKGQVARLCSRCGVSIWQNPITAEDGTIFDIIRKNASIISEYAS